MTEQEIPEEIIEAREILEKFETSDNHLERVRCFEDGIDMLNDYLEENADTPHAHLITNIKLSYTRILLQRLRDYAGIEINDWIKYIFIFLKKWRR